jgi:hypothetical protein
VFGLSLRVRSKLATIGGCVLKHRHEIVAGAFVTNRLKRLCSELVGINPQKLRHVPSTRFQIRIVQRWGSRSAHNGASGWWAADVGPHVDHG